VLLKALTTEVAPGGGRERTLDVETQATVARSTALLQAVGDRLGLTAAEVKAASRVEAAPTGDVLFIYFVDDEAEFAAEGALAYTEEYLGQRKSTADNAAKRQKSLLETQVDTLEAEITELTAQIEDQIALGDAGLTQSVVLQTRQNLAIRDVAAATDEIARIDDDQVAGQVVVDPRTAVNRTGLKVGFTVGGGLAVGLLVGVVVALLRDRRDDRYGSALGLEGLGVHEEARIRFPEARATGGRLDSVRRDYARLLVRLRFSGQAGASTSRSILLLAVESSTLPADSANAVASALAAEGPDNGLTALILESDRERIVDGGGSTPYWSLFVQSLRQANNDNDIVIVTAGSFDRSVAGLSIASKVDQVVLLVSLATPVSHVVATIEDLQSIDARDVGVVVLTRVPSRRRRR
jgi:hypothetical protein